MIQCVCVYERVIHTSTHRQSESENESKNKSMSERLWVKESVPSERGMREHKRGK